MPNGNGHHRNQMTRHHMIPTSRGGKDVHTNIKMVAEKFHQAYHLLFQNMTPTEVIEHIKREWSPREP